MARTALDHVPCVVTMTTSIPKAHVFCFENYWVNLPGFIDCVTESWGQYTGRTSAAEVNSAKFKALRYALKNWHTNLCTIKRLIADCNMVILFFDDLEQHRTLSIPEFNFRHIVKLHLEEVLHLQYVYWKQRCTIKSIKVGEENSKKNSRHGHGEV